MVEQTNNGVLQKQAMYGATALIVLLGSYFAWSFLSRKKKALLGAQQWQKFPLVKKDEVTHDTKIFRFALPNPEMELGLPVGKHIKLRFHSDEEKDFVVRPYTPITTEDTKGYFELLIKVYPKGRMGQYLDALDIGAKVEVSGPTGHLNYDRPGHIVAKRPRKTLEYSVKKLNMVAGGTGITPMYQVIQHIIANQEDSTQTSMLFGNLSINDILLHNELKKVNEVDGCKVHFTLDKAPETGWDGSQGYVTGQMISEHLFEPSEDTVTLLCGPGPMCMAVKKTMIGMGYKKESILSF